MIVYMFKLEKSNNIFPSKIVQNVLYSLNKINYGFITTNYIYTSICFIFVVCASKKVQIKINILITFL